MSTWVIVLIVVVLLLVIVSGSTVAYAKSSASSCVGGSEKLYKLESGEIVIDKSTIKQCTGTKNSKGLYFVVESNGAASVYHSDDTKTPRWTSKAFGNYTMPPYQVKLEKGQLIVTDATGNKQTIRDFGNDVETVKIFDNWNDANNETKDGIKGWVHLPTYNSMSDCTGVSSASYIYSTTGSLLAGDKIGNCRGIKTADYSFVLQSDGNVVMFNLVSGKKIWESGKPQGTGPYALDFDNASGTLKLTDSTGKLHWQSDNTKNKFNVFDISTGVPLFKDTSTTANTASVLSTGMIIPDYKNCLGNDITQYTIATTGLIPGGIIKTCNGIESTKFILVLQSNGNLVLFDKETKSAVWASGTAGKGQYPYDLEWDKNSGIIKLRDLYRNIIWQTANTQSTYDLFDISTKTPTLKVSTPGSTIANYIISNGETAANIAFRNNCTGVTNGNYKLINQLNAGGYIPSCTGIKTNEFILVLQSNGNLVLWNTKTGKAVWASNTASNLGNPPYSIHFNAVTKNLILTDSVGLVIWQTSNTNKSLDTLDVTTSGSLRFTSSTTAGSYKIMPYKPTTATATAATTACSGADPSVYSLKTTLKKGDAEIAMCGGIQQNDFILVVTNSGNLVLYNTKTKTMLWKSNTANIAAGQGPFKLKYSDSTGTLELLNKDGKVLWTSNNTEKSYTTVSLADGTVKLVSADGQKVSQIIPVL